MSETSEVTTTRVPSPRVGRWPKIAVVADQSLTGQAVGEALTSLGFNSSTFAVPQQGSGVRDLRARLSRQRVEVALLLHERLDWAHTLEAMRIIREIGDVPWVLLSESDDDARWGAALDAGAAAVLSISVGVDQLINTVGVISAGGEITPADERRRLVAVWEEVGEEERRLTQRLDRLSCRERQVLDDLSRGQTVAEIAADSFVSIGTVRSQVRAVLTKLEVQSQIAAVALLERVSTVPAA
ncbi:helix-turn-helix transcriptional regulator [Nocardioides sp. Bht2]|uniref:helix-turn-helix transcriptional regulator n=1 Tax=Nocardioides sp. Bht2 TaxID=3392297 RepID=UPI0039B461A1